jgi:hypothetical protein
MAQNKQIFSMLTFYISDEISDQTGPAAFSLDLLL